MEYLLHHIFILTFCYSIFFVENDNFLIFIIMDFN